MSKPRIVRLVIDCVVTSPDLLRKEAFERRENMWNDVDDWISAHNGDIPLHLLLFEVMAGSSETPSPSEMGYEISEVRGE